MATYDIAHIREQREDLIIVPLQSSFDYRTATEQDETRGYLQACSNAAGLAGTVVPVWEKSDGRMAFLAPQNYHPYFRSINMYYVRTNINRTLTCS